MKIIGFSGFEDAMSFKRREFPGLEEREYRIVQGQDAAAAILVDGEIRAAAAEERFDGRKHSGAFPSGAIRYCAAQAGIDLGEVDAFVHSFDYAPYRIAYSLNDLSKRRLREVYSRDALLGLFQRSLPEVKDHRERLFHVEHHVAHAASAFTHPVGTSASWSSLDGMGEVHSTTV